MSTVQLRPIYQITCHFNYNLHVIGLLSKVLLYTMGEYIRSQVIYNPYVIGPLAYIQDHMSKLHLHVIGPLSYFICLKFKIFMLYVHFR